MSVFCKILTALWKGVAIFAEVPHTFSPLFTPAIPFRLETLGYDQISSLTGWLSAAYAAGLIIATFPFVWLGARTPSKRNLLLAALTLMAVGVVILMVVPNYAAMVAGRVLQGASGAGIWTLGLALGACPADAPGGQGTFRQNVLGPVRYYVD